jgi:hypothetical protein
LVFPITRCPDHRITRSVPPPPIPQLAFQRTYAIQSRGCSTDLLLPISVISGSSLLFRSRRFSAGPPVIGGFQFWQLPNFGNSGDLFFSPTRPFPNFCCKQKHFHHSTLGPPLRHAWVALGPRLGHPRATQSQTQSNLCFGQVWLKANG